MGARQKYELGIGLMNWRLIDWEVKNWELMNLKLMDWAVTAPENGDSSSVIMETMNLKLMN